MNVEDFFLEGTRPAILPNAGTHFYCLWSKADLVRFGQLLRKKYPNVLFYDSLSLLDEEREDFKIRIVESIDQARPQWSLKAVFPPPGWKPNLVHVRPPDRPKWPYWTWENYLSPIISIASWRPPHAEWDWTDWYGTAADAPIQTWKLSGLSTSYRRELHVEKRIASAVVRLAANLCRQLVPVRWTAYDAYQRRDGNVNKRSIGRRRMLATQAVIDWSRAKPRREIYMSPARGEIATTWHPPEDVPDSWWGDTPKPKWAQRP